jgi:glycosyltransferase involved in cell wall biosynthesis
LRNASAVSAVDGGLVDDMRTQFGEDFGAVVIPTGYDPEFYRPSGTKERIVLSVCSVNNHRGLVKGIDIFAECARMMPDIKFVLVGTRGDAVKLLGEVPINLEVIGSLPPQDLLGYYQKAKVYCQLSMREGLPNAVCEAMLCDCVAVGSDVQGIRTAIGEHGFLVPYGDVSRTCDAIRKAMESDGMGGRDHIIASFPDSKRRDGLTELINELLKR